MLATQDSRLVGNAKLGRIYAFKGQEPTQRPLEWYHYFARQLWTPDCGVDMSKLFALVLSLLEAAQHGESARRKMGARVDRPTRFADFQLSLKDAPEARLVTAIIRDEIVLWRPGLAGDATWSAKRNRK